MGREAIEFCGRMHVCLHPQFYYLLVGDFSPVSFSVDSEPQMHDDSLPVHKRHDWS